MADSEETLAAQTRIPWQQYLQEYCRNTGQPQPVWNLVSERRGKSHNRAYYATTVLHRYALTSQGVRVAEGWSGFVAPLPPA